MKHDNETTQDETNASNGADAAAAGTENAEGSTAAGGEGEEEASQA